MNKEFDDILNEKLWDLPAHEPDGELWSIIEAGLDTEEAISNRLQKLPQYAPSARIWEAIETALPAGSLPGSQASTLSCSHADSLSGSQAGSQTGPWRRLVWIAAAAAATVILLVGIPWLLRSGHEIVVESEITVSEEYDGNQLLRSNEEDPLEMIESLCKTGVPVCQSEAFREKLQLCRELDEQLRQLETVIDRVGGSPEIIQAFIRIENLKSGTLQELIQLIHS